MSQTLSRCINQSRSVTIPQLKCDNSIMGDFGNLSDFGQAIGSLPSQLGNIAYCVGSELRDQILATIESLRKTLESIFKAINTTIPTPLFEKLNAPEIEYELRARSMWQDFKLYLQQKLFDILKNIPGLSFIVNLVNIPIPFLSGVRVFDVFTAEGRAKIRAAVGDRVDAIADAMGLPWNITYDQDLGLKVPELKRESIIGKIFSEIGKLLSSALWAALNAIPNLLKPIKDIWDAFGFPFLPSWEAPKFEDVFRAIWTPIKNLAVSTVEKIEKTIDALLNFDLGAFLSAKFGAILALIPWPTGTKVKDMLKEPDPEKAKEWSITAPNLRLGSLVSKIQNLFDNIPQLILELWMSLVKPFFEAIKNILAGISQLLAYIPFTFCTFLNLVAAPLLGFGQGLAGQLPPGIAFNPSS